MYLLFILLLKYLYIYIYILFLSVYMYIYNSAIDSKMLKKRTLPSYSSCLNVYK